MTETQQRAGTVSLVLGIIGLFVYPIILGAVALFMGAYAESKAGVILGLIDIVVGVVMLLIFL